jgi:hypothetical protein
MLTDRAYRLVALAVLAGAYALGCWLESLTTGI